MDICQQIAVPKHQGKKNKIAKNVKSFFQQQRRKQVIEKRPI